MFLFPLLDWGIDMSDFEKIDFLGHGLMGDFWVFLAFFAAATLTPLGRKLSKSVIWKFF